jgi:hypothetical protein
METPDNRPIPCKSSEPAAPDFQQQYLSLRRLCAWLLISNLLIGGALGLYLLRQVFVVNRQVAEFKRFVDDYKVNALPHVSSLVSNLQAFAKTNPDFNPILAKYNLLPNNTPAARQAIPPAPSTPAPKTPPPKK